MRWLGISAGLTEASEATLSGCALEALGLDFIASGRIAQNVTGESHGLGLAAFELRAGELLHQLEYARSPMELRDGDSGSYYRHPDGGFPNTSFVKVAEVDQTIVPTVLERSGTISLQATKSFRALQIHLRRHSCAPVTSSRSTATDGLAVEDEIEFNGI